jgi:hypothetical protein
MTEWLGRPVRISKDDRAAAQMAALSLSRGCRTADWATCDRSPARSISASLVDSEQRQSGNPISWLALPSPPPALARVNVGMK